MLKTSEVSRVRSTYEHFDVFNSRDEIYLVFTEKSRVPFYFILFLATCNVSPTEKNGAENAKKKKTKKKTKKISKPK